MDAALLRPGRVDCIIELREAVRQQAEDLFNTFYKPYDEEVPGYDLSQVPTWAKSFARQVKDHEFSCASLQNFLLDHRTDPAGAIEAFPKWLENKRTQKSLGEHATDKAEAAQEDIKGADYKFAYQTSLTH